jgi:SAM-dependent methyltransferase
VLDVASGTGLATRAAARYGIDGLRHICLDLSSGQLRHGRAAFPAAMALCADAGRIPLATGSVDLVLCASSAGYFADLPSVLAEFARVLRPGGRLAMQTWAADADGVTRMLRDAARRSGIVLYNPHETLGSRRRAARLLNDAGFVAVRCVSGTWTATLPDDPALTWIDLLGGIVGAPLREAPADLRRRIRDDFYRDLIAARAACPTVRQQVLVACAETAPAPVT